MGNKNVIQEIVERRKIDIQNKGYSFGHNIPETRTTKVRPFMESKGAILEVKRASPSKGDIAPNLDLEETVLSYIKNGAKAISCLTEENYFKGSLEDLINVAKIVRNYEKETGLLGPAILRKDFLIEEEEIEIAFRCGADAVLLICDILSLEKLKSMASKCKSLGMRALVEVRSDEDVQKVLELKKDFEDTIVCGVNSRNLKDFSIDLFVPAMLKNKLGGKVIFESGISTVECASNIASMGFFGFLMGEFAARNPKKAGSFVEAFMQTEETLNGKGTVELATMIKNRMAKINHPMVKICGLTRKEDVLKADELGADFVGFIFATEFGRNVYGEKFNAIRSVLPKIKAKKVAVITKPLSEEAKAACELVKEGVLDFIQIHCVEYNNVPDYMLEVPHYFAVSNKNGNLLENCKLLDSYGEARFLQDTKNKDYFQNQHLWMAGGLTCENVKELVKEFNPELIDISSGIEDDEIGVKNHSKMEKLFEQIQL